MGIKNMSNFADSKIICPSQDEVITREGILAKLKTFEDPRRDLLILSETMTDVRKTRVESMVLGPRECLRDTLGNGLSISGQPPRDS